MVGLNNSTKTVALVEKQLVGLLMQCFCFVWRFFGHSFIFLC